LFEGNGREDASVSEELLEYCSAYVHALGAGSTLTNAKILLDANSVKAHNVTVVVKNVMTQIAKSGMKDEERMSRLAEAGAIGDTVSSQVSKLPTNTKLILGVHDVATRMVEEVRQAKEQVSFDDFVDKTKSPKAKEQSSSSAIAQLVKSSRTSSPSKTLEITLIKAPSAETTEEEK
jgi:hypothetical protein